MANSVVQTIRDAEVDARSLSEFVSKGASFTVTRRLAPTIHTLDYYLNIFDVATNNIDDQLLLAKQRADATVSYIEQTVSNAIDNTVIDNSPLSDALVSVDGSLSQRTINKGLESIADLSTINNPKDGLRVYVKSYHAGLGKGGGYFTYDSSKSSVNDDGTVINGWVRQLDGSQISISCFGAKSDGVSDDTDAINKAIQNSMGLVVTVPTGITCISDTIVLGQRGKALVGESEVLFQYHPSYSNGVIKWIGGVEPRKTMIQLGQNKVGAEPATDTTAIIAKNLYLDGNNEVGFLMYGTYLTNETLINRVAGRGSTEYNFYFAMMWYAAIDGLYSRNCKNNGIALGIPLVYSDGERVDWSTPSPLEINNCKIVDVRSSSSGENYSVDNKGTWRLTHDTKWHGYGVGFGVGNGFRVNSFVSEGSGGLNLFSYNLSQPSKTVSNGYLEGANKGAGTTASDNMANILLDYSEATGAASGHIYSDIFCNYASGGVYVARGDKPSTITLERVYQPRFLKDLDGTHEFSVWEDKHPSRWVRRKNCYPSLGQYNITKEGSPLIEEKDINLKNYWSYDLPDTEGYKVVWIRSKGKSITPTGSIRFYAGADFTIRSLPPVLPADTWVPVLSMGASAFKITKAGNDPIDDEIVDIKVTEAGLTNVWG